MTANHVIIEMATSHIVFMYALLLDRMIDPEDQLLGVSYPNE